MGPDLSDDEIRHVAKLIDFATKNAKVKTASPSRAQNKIQVRISWKDSSGKSCLGYFSVSSKDAESYVKYGVRSSSTRWHQFIGDVFRVYERSLRAYPRGLYHYRLRDELVGLGTHKKIESLLKDSIETIRNCAAEGKHTSARQARNRAKAKHFIERAIDFAINQGFRDSEIHEIINEVYVKNVMES